MINEAALTLGFRFSSMASEAIQEDETFDPPEEHCQHCLTPLWKGETVPGHGWCV